MNKKTIISILFAIVAMTGWAQEIKMNETTINDYIPMNTAPHFSLERYAFGVYLELRKAMEGLVEK